jgi:hypothetical protein
LYTISKQITKTIAEKRRWSFLNPETRILICRLTEKIKQDEKFAQQLNIKDISYYRNKTVQYRMVQGEKKNIITREG